MMTSPDGYFKTRSFISIIAMVKKSMETLLIVAMQIKNKKKGLLRWNVLGMD
jgi:hypothetical protein